MRRGMLSLLILLAPVMGTLMTAGCEPEIKSVQKTERVQESEPQPVSPGETVLE